MLVLSCVCSAQPLNARAHGAAMSSPSWSRASALGSQCRWDSPCCSETISWLILAWLRACFFPGGIHGGDGDFLSAGLESNPWKSEKIRRTGWTL